MASSLVLPLGVAVVRGNSMRPTLQDGDVVLVRYGGGVRPGRLVVVRLDGGVVAVKRASARDPDGWWVESDDPSAAGAVDSWRLRRPVPVKDVVGVVLGRLPLRGRRAQRT